jgi:glycerol-3-phosphate acyltransferase PlsX
MGGDRAPGEIVAGAQLALETHGIPVVLFGDPAAIGDTGGIEVVATSEVIDMDDDPAKAVRRKKDASMVRCAEAVRDGKALAMVGAGNTGATMGSALLRMGRLKGVSRPAIATPIPNSGGNPSLLLDSGANAECTPEMLLLFAKMGAVYSTARYGVENPTIALLSIGEEKSKGTPTVKEAHALLAEIEGLNFIGNVEGRDLLHGAADVIVTDGFTGNVALKTLEGAVKFMVNAISEVFNADEDTKRASEVLLPHLLPLAVTLDPDNTGGAALLGVDGVCVISHGSSSAQAISSAIKVAADVANGGLVEHLRQAVALPEA